jgi:hypothetical protein
MLTKRFRIDFDEIFSYAIQEDNSCQFTTALIKNADQDVAEINLETLKNYNYVYCASDNTFVSHVGREFSSSAKNYGLMGLKASALGVGVSLGFNGDLSASALALGVGAAGGAVIGGIVGGVSAINARMYGRILKTPEQKERVAELLKIAESRVAFFNPRAPMDKTIQIVIHNEPKDDKNYALVK